MLIIITILWGIMAAFLLIQNAEFCVELNIIDKIIVGIILVLGAPMLILASVLQSILNLFLPEGWDNDDDDNFKKP